MTTASAAKWIGPRGQNRHADNSKKRSEAPPTTGTTCPFRITKRQAAPGLRQRFEYLRQRRELLRLHVQREADDAQVHARVPPHGRVPDHLVEVVFVTNVDRA